MFTNKTKQDAARRRRAIAGCEALEGRQMLTRGVFNGMPAIDPFAGTAQTAQARPLQAAGSSLGGGGGPAAFFNRGGDAMRGRAFGGGLGGASMPMQSQTQQDMPGPSGGFNAGGGRSMPGPFGRLGGGRGFGGRFAGPSAAFGSPVDPSATPAPVTPTETTPVDPAAADAVVADTAAVAPVVAPPDAPEAPSEAVQAAAEALRTAIDPIFAVKKPTHASVGGLLDTLEAIQAETLTGDDATAKIRADETAILTSAGATQEQIDDVLAKADALRAAIADDGGDASQVTILGPGGPHGGMPGPGGPMSGPSFGGPKSGQYPGVSTSGQFPGGPAGDRGFGPRGPLGGSAFGGGASGWGAPRGY